MSTNDRSSLLVFSVSSNAFTVQTTPESNNDYNACSSQNQYVQEDTLVVVNVNAPSQVNINIYSQVFGFRPNKRKWRGGRKRKKIAIAERTFMLRATWHQCMLSFPMVVLTKAHLLVYRSLQEKLPEKSILVIFYAHGAHKKQNQCVRTFVGVQHLVPFKRLNIKQTTHCK